MAGSHIFPIISLMLDCKSLNHLSYIYLSLQQYLVLASLKTLSNSKFVHTMWGSKNEVMIQWDISKKQGGRAQKLVGGQNQGQRKQVCQSRRLRGQTLLGLTFFKLLSSSSNWRIRTSLVVSSSLRRRSSSCCRKNIRRSYVQKTETCNSSFSLEKKKKASCGEHWKLYYSHCTSHQVCTSCTG